MGQVTETAPVVLLRGELTPERMLTWFETVVAVQRAAAGSQEFFGAGGAGRWSTWSGSTAGWCCCARARTGRSSASTASPRSPDRPSAAGCCARCCCARTRPTARGTRTCSPAAPLRRRGGRGADPRRRSDEVLGVLYGVRDVPRPPDRPKGLGSVEAQVVQLLAAVVGTGLARQQQEAEATRSRVQFEQFFTPELAVHLQHNPRLLEPQERELTVLFADMRGFVAPARGPRAAGRLRPDERPAGAHHGLRARPRGRRRRLHGRRPLRDVERPGRPARPRRARLPGRAGHDGASWTRSTAPGASA